MTHAFGRRTLLGTAAAGLAAPAVLRAQDSTIKIGFPVPLTGPYRAIQFCRSGLGVSGCEGT